MTFREICRKKIGGRVRGSEMTRKPARKPHGICRLAPAEVCVRVCVSESTCRTYIYIYGVVTKGSYFLLMYLSFFLQEIANQSYQTQHSHKINVSNGDIVKEVNSMVDVAARKQSIDKLEDASHVKNASQGDIPFSVPLQVSTSSGFAWAKRRKDDASIRSHSRSTSRGHIYNIVEPTALHTKNNFDSKRHENGDVIHGARTNSRGHDSYEIAKLAMQNNWCKFERPDSFDASDEYHSQELSMAQYQKEEMAAKRSNIVSLLE